MIKRIVKGGLKVLWDATRPLRRPFVRKFQSFLERCLQNSGRQLTDETNLLMSHLIRELVRLQRQVELLQEAVEQRADASGSLSVVREDEDEARRKAG
jgi:hypothetical protein